MGNTKVADITYLSQDGHCRHFVVNLQFRLGQGGCLEMNKTPDGALVRRRA